MGYSGHIRRQAIIGWTTKNVFPFAECYIPFFAQAIVFPPIDFDEVYRQINRCHRQD